MARFSKATREMHKATIRKLLARGLNYDEMQKQTRFSRNYIAKLIREIAEDYRKEHTERLEKILYLTLERYEDLIKLGYQTLARAMQRDKEKDSLYYTVKALRLLKDIQNDYASFYAKITGADKMEITTNILNAPNISIEEFKEMIRKEMKELEKETLEELR